MPEIRKYTVVQIRTVEVTANNEVDAARIASAAFEHGQDANGSVIRGKGPEGVWGNTDKAIKVTSLKVERNR